MELRWGLACNILHALTAMGRWRLDVIVCPANKRYDLRSFVLLSHAAIMAQRAVDCEGAIPT